MKIIRGLRRASGYGDCWDCCEVVVDPYRFKVKIDGEFLVINLCPRCCDERGI